MKIRPCTHTRNILILTNDWHLSFPISNIRLVSTFLQFPGIECWKGKMFLINAKKPYLRVLFLLFILLFLSNGWRKKWRSTRKMSSDWKSTRIKENQYEKLNACEMRFSLSLFAMSDLGLFSMDATRLIHDNGSTSHSTSVLAVYAVRTFIHHSNAKHAHKNVYAAEVTISKWQSMKNEKWSLRAKAPHCCSYFLW